MGKAKTSDRTMHPVDLLAPVSPISWDNIALRGVTSSDQSRAHEKRLNSTVYGYTFLLATLTSRSSTSSEDLAGPRGRGVEHAPQGFEHAPQGFLAQPDMRAGPQRIERGEGDRPCLIPRGATPFQARGRVVLGPALALAVADQNSGRGESCIPGRRGPLSPASDEPVLEMDSRECRNRHLGTERLDQGTIGRPIGSARRRRQITVGKEGLDGGPEPGLCKRSKFK